MMKEKFKKVPLSEVCEVIAGQSPPSSTYNDMKEGVPFFQGKADFGRLYPVTRMWCSAPKKISLPDDILMSIRAPVGSTNINNIEACIGRGLSAIRCSDKIDRNFLLHYFRCNEKIIADKGTGSTFKAITQKVLKALKIPLPPLPEQQKIAEILDAADALRQKDQQLIDHYTALSQSLFLDMFGDPVSNLKGWSLKNLDEIANSQLGKMLSKKSMQNINPKKYLRNANVRWGQFDLSVVLEMDFNEKEIQKFNLSYGDLLVCEGGEVGRCAIWKNNLKDCYFQKALHRVRVNQQILIPEYLQEFFFWMAKLGGLASSVSEVTFSHLTGEKLKKLKVPLPPIQLQNKFAHHISLIEKQKQQAQASLEQSNNLFNSLLQKAFKGELTA